LVEKTKKAIKCEEMTSLSINIGVNDVIGMWPITTYHPSKNVVYYLLSKRLRMMTKYLFRVNITIAFF